MAQLLQSNSAPGGPGASPTWSRSDKDGVGTALSGSSLLWYTVAGGIVTEVYYPNVDTPQIRDFQLLITDGSTFFHDGTRDDTYTCEPMRDRKGRTALVCFVLHILPAPFPQ